jgi:hypothetical protein
VVRWFGGSVVLPIEFRQGCGIFDNTHPASPMTSQRIRLWIVEPP